MTTTRKLMAGGGTYVDDRLGSASFFRRNMKKIFPDHWSFLLGEIALWCFIIVILTGVFLTLWFKPSMTEVVYHGSYDKLDGVRMSEAYASTLHLSFDVRGGLLMRQIHHWAANVFVASIMVHLLRVFFTGAFRKPRELNWVIGFLLFNLVFINSFIGYGLPDDMLSGTGLKITQGIAMGVPVVGTWFSFFLFGGEYPGEDVISRLFTIHVLLLPGIILALVTAHLMIMWHQKHTQHAGKGKTERNVIGQPFYPMYMAKQGAFFFLTFGVLALMGAFIQVNPVWLYGPYTPSSVTSDAQADWYFAFLEGSVRLMPGWEYVIFGHTLSLSIIIPALIIPGILLTGLAVYPFIEQWATGDKRHHNILDRPRNAPTRAGVGVAGIIFYGVLWAAGGNDLIAYAFHISLYVTTWSLRVLLFAGPVIGFIITKRICLGLQRRDKETLEHGVESGTIKRLPSGEFIEVTESPSEDEEAVIRAKKPLVRLAELPATDENGVPAPGTRGLLGKARLALNRIYTADDVDVVEDGHGGRREEVESEEREELTSSGD